MPARDPYEFEPFAATPSSGDAAVLIDVPAEVAAADVVAMTFAGGDPWLGAPLVTIRTADGDALTDAAGVPWSSDGYAIGLELSPDPPYDQRKADSRTFAWTASVPVRRAYAGGPDLSLGPLHLVARGRLARAGGGETDYVVESGPFVVRP